MLKNSILRKIFFTCSFAACSVLALSSSGCVSGGFKLTRSYARFVNNQHIILRVILYILTAVVFAVTLLIDVIYYNTVDFWNGNVSAGVYNFKVKDRSYVAKHEYLPQTNLRQSTIQIFNETNKLLQTVVLRETTSGEVELYVDGKLRTRVSDLSKLPVARHFDATGKLVEEKILRFDSAVAMN